MCPQGFAWSGQIAKHIIDLGVRILISILKST